MRKTSLIPCALLAAALATPALGACGTDNGNAPDASFIDDQPPDPPPARDAATPTPPAFEGGIQPEDSGVGPPPDGGNDLSNCLDPNDPGGTEPTSRSLGNTDDCDKNRQVVRGVARGAADVDMYRVTLADKTLCRQDGVFKVEGNQLELCVFLQCKVNGSTTDVKSCSGGVKRDSDTGLHGCCVNSPNELKIDWNCTGTIDEQSDVYFRVKPSQNTCEPYTLTYNF